MASIELDPAADAADAADSFLAVHAPGTTVVRDPSEVYANAEVIAFDRTPAVVDDAFLIVERGTGVVRLVQAPPWEPHPFPGLRPLDELDDL